MIDINLLPWRDEEHKKQKHSFLVSFGIYIALIFAVLIIIHILFSRALSNQKYRNYVLQQEIQATDQIIQKTQNAKNKLNEIKKKLTKIEDLYNNRHELILFINELNKVTPKNVRLTKIEYSDRGVELTGLAPSNASISQLMKNIVNSDVFKTPSLKEVKKENLKANGKKRFNLKASLQKVSS